MKIFISIWLLTPIYAWCQQPLDSALMTPVNLASIHDHLSVSDSAAFNLFRYHEATIDGLMKKKSYSRDALVYAISVASVDPVLKASDQHDQSPDWRNLEDTLSVHYGATLSQAAILDARIRWFGFKKQWKEFSHAIVEKTEKEGPYGLIDDRAIQLNEIAWTIFQHTDNRDDLEKALRWSEEAVKLNSNLAHLDTKANLLYRLGRTDEAILTEEQAIATDPHSIIAVDSRDALKKMKRGEPTWPKPVIDTVAISQWISLQLNPKISADGKYVAYVTRQGQSYQGNLTIISADGKWKKQYAGAGAEFSKNDDVAVIQQGPDLLLLHLGGEPYKILNQNAHYQLIYTGGKSYLLCQTKSDSVMITDVKTGTSHFLGNANFFKTNKKEDAAILIDSLNGQTILFWTDLPSRGVHEFWRGSGSPQLLFSSFGDDLVFGIPDSTQQISLWQYRKGWKNATELPVTNTFAGNYVNRLDRFNGQGNLLFFDFVTRRSPVINTIAKLDVWNYKDARVQAEQLDNAANPTIYKGVINLKTGQFTRLQFDGEEFNFLGDGRYDVGIISQNNGGNATNFLMDSDVRPRWYLVNTATAKRTLIEGNFTTEFSQLSPDGRYLILESEDRRTFWSYEISTEKRSALTDQLPIPAVDTGDVLIQKGRGLTYAGWLDNGELILYDRYDVWEIDPSNIHQPLCLTNGYGRKHSIVFRLPQQSGEAKTHPANQSLLLCALNRANKQNGFFSVMPGRVSSFRLLSMDDCFYNFPLVSDFGDNTLFGGELIKADHADMYIVSREDNNVSPNYFLTSDFEQFHQLTSIRPERNYNWLTADLIKFAVPGHDSSLAVIYKPEDFDSTKKYPVIFFFYETLSDQLHRFEAPALSVGDINIPWFVSRGYIVVTPDIRYQNGFPGKSALDYVMAARDYIKQYPWVDSMRMATAGHSFGGFENNYILTHIPIFAAALSASGMSDQISLYDDINFGYKNQNYDENGQGRLGATLWEKPDRYLDNSPVLSADCITTPLLMMNNKNDGAVPFSQGVEFYMALRRLHKRVWLLQYDDEDHILLGQQAQLDFTLRLTQFFDYYLKNTPPPVWMTRGIPAKLKGVDSGFEYDDSAAIP